MAHENLNDAAFKGLSASRAGLRVVRTDEDLKAVVESMESGTHFLLEAGEHTVTGIVRANGVEICGQTIKTEATEDWREVFRRLTRREFEKGDDAPHKKILAYDSTRKTFANESPKNEILSEAVAKASQKVVLKKMPYSLAMEQAREIARRENDIVYLQPTGGGYWDIHEDLPAGATEYAYVTPAGTIHTIKEEFDCQITPEAAEMAEGPFMFRLNGSIVCRGTMPDLNHFAASKAMTFKETESEFGGHFEGEGITLTPEHRIPAEILAQRDESLEPYFRQMAEAIETLEAESQNKEPLSQFVAGLKSAYEKLVSYHNGDVTSWAEGKVVALAGKVLGEHLPGKAKEITKLCNDLVALVAEVEKRNAAVDEATPLKSDNVKAGVAVVAKKPTVAAMVNGGVGEHPIKRGQRGEVKAIRKGKALVRWNDGSVSDLRLPSDQVALAASTKNEAEIDQKAVVKAAVDAAQDIHGKPDMKIIQSMVKNAISKGAKDTEDAIQIVINMMRSKEAMEAIDPKVKAIAGAVKQWFKKVGLKASVTAGKGKAQWIRASVRPGEIPNKYRLQAVVKVMGERPSEPEDVSFGNIQKHEMAMRAPQWSKFLGLQGVRMAASTEAGVGKPLFSKPTKDGKGTFQVLKRDTAGMTGKQDAFSMRVVDQRGKVLKDWGSHPSLKGAQKFARNKGLIEAEIDVDAVRRAAVNAAKDIHGKPDLKIINSMIGKAKAKAKDTEDAVQIVIDMMRAGATETEEEFWKKKGQQVRDKSRWMIKFDQSVKKIVPGVFMKPPREYDNIATSFFSQGADPSKSGIRYGSRLKKRLPALAASTKTESTSLTEAGSKGLTVQQLVERIVPDDDMPDEPLQKTYIQYIRQGNVYKPFGTGTFHEKLLRQAYRLVRGMNGIEFHRAKAKTDELYRFENSVMESVIAEIDRFWDLKEDYEKFGVMHNRGILLEGPPGTGKSSVIQQIVEMMVNRGDVVFFSNRVSMVKDALHAFKEVEEKRAVVVVLEDADEHIKYEQNEFLQLLDGDEAVEGVLYLATTNYVENFPARLRRPGRFDKIVHVGPPPFEGRFVYLKNKIGKVENDKEITRLANLTKGLSFGHLRELVTAAYALKEPKDEVLKRITSKIHGGVVEAKKGRGKASVDGAEATESIVSVTIKGDNNAALARTINSIVDALENLPEFCGMYTEEDNGSSSCLKVRMKNGNPKAACNLVMKALETASIPVQNLTIESYTFQPGQRAIRMPNKDAAAAQAIKPPTASRTGADSQAPNEKRKKGKKGKNKDPFSKVWRESEATQEQLDKASSSPKFKKYVEHVKLHAAAQGHSKRIAPIRIAPYFNSNTSSTLAAKKIAETAPDDTPFSKHGAKQGPTGPAFQTDASPFRPSKTQSYNRKFLAVVKKERPDIARNSKKWIDAANFFRTQRIAPEVGAKRFVKSLGSKKEAQKPFKNWMRQVDKEVGKKVGISAQDLPDVPYADWHDDGMSPKAAAAKAIKMAKESATEAKHDPKYVAMGKKAFKQGKKAVPIHDPALSKELKNISKAGGTVKPALTAWLKGWHQANAAAPVKSGKTEAASSIDMKTYQRIKKDSIEHQKKKFGMMFKDDMAKKYKLTPDLTTKIHYVLGRIRDFPSSWEQKELDKLKKGGFLKEAMGGTPGTSLVGPDHKIIQKGTKKKMLALLKKKGGRKAGYYLALTSKGVGQKFGEDTTEAKITVPTISGPKTVSAKLIGKYLAVHQTPSPVTVGKGLGYSITHVPTKLGFVQKLKKESNAIKIAKAFEKEFADSLDFKSQANAPDRLRKEALKVMNSLRAKFGESVAEGKTGEISQNTVDRLRQKMGSIKMTDIRDEPPTHADDQKVPNKHFRPNEDPDTVVAKTKRVATVTVKKGYVDE